MGDVGTSSIAIGPWSVTVTPETVAILSTHKQRAAQQCLELGTTLTDDSFVFSYAPDHHRRQGRSGTRWQPSTTRL